MNEENKIPFDSDDDWNIDFSDLVDEPAETDNEDTAAAEEKEDTDVTPEANPAEEVTEDGAGEPEPEAQPEADQLFDLKVLGEDRRLTLAEMKAAAQKGLDYDRIKNRNQELQKEKEANAAAVGLVKELAESQNLTVDQLITNVRAAALAKKEGITVKEAIEKVQLKAREDAVSKREAAFQEQDAAEKKAEEEKAARNKEFVQFFSNHPTVKPNDIPQQCFVDMKNGIPLEYSYSKQIAAKKEAEANKTLSEKDSKIKELEERLAALEKEKNSQTQNQINAARSVGSADTAGKVTKDELFESLWNDGN